MADSRNVENQNTTASFRLRRLSKYFLELHSDTSHKFGNKTAYINIEISPFKRFSLFLIRRR